MNTKTKNLKEGKADAGLLFVTGLFFLTLAFTVIYFSYFGLAPLPKSNKSGEMTAVAALALPEPSPASSEATSFVEIENKEQNEAPAAPLPQARVKEIFIGSYGNVDKEISEELRSRIEKTYGVKTTLLNPGPAVPKEEPFYNKSRNQYNSDVLQKSIEQSSAVYGDTVRFLYLVNFEMASFSEWSPKSPWLRAEEGVNATIVSLSAFGKNDKSEVSRQILLERAEKTAIRALGITVGFDLLPSATDASCIMHPALTLEDLDAQKNTLCGPESEAVARIFRR